MMTKFTNSDESISTPMMMVFLKIISYDDFFIGLVSTLIIAEVFMGKLSNNLPHPLVILTTSSLPASIAYVKP
jgi:hypothetical protein